MRRGRSRKIVRFNFKDTQFFESDTDSKKGAGFTPSIRKDKANKLCNFSEASIVDKKKPNLKLPKIKSLGMAKKPSPLAQYLSANSTPKSSDGQPKLKHFKNRYAVKNGSKKYSEFLGIQKNKTSDILQIIFNKDYTKESESPKTTKAHGKSLSKIESQFGLSHLNGRFLQEKRIVPNIVRDFCMNSNKEVMIPAQTKCDLLKHSKQELEREFNSRGTKDFNSFIE
ncbi:unnamed protein product [Moneuplotes crassus]|uniref:Uncharacterized protein n=1 Tax=Euplotes crassus TaxID=5936 RepID=A0AAD1UC43_EUPCR|nr:unnamed protein product [Moneuplotes crassus]